MILITFESTTPVGMISLTIPINDNIHIICNILLYYYFNISVIVHVNKSLL
jgi:hypothetical protein